MEMYLFLIFCLFRDLLLYSLASFCDAKQRLCVSAFYLYENKAETRTKQETV